LELEDEGEGSLLSYYLTEEGIFLASHVRDVERGFHPVWDNDVKEIEISDYVTHAAWALDEFRSREARFGVSEDK